MRAVDDLERLRTFQSEVPAPDADSWARARRVLSLAMSDEDQIDMNLPASAREGTEEGPGPVPKSSPGRRLHITTVAVGAIAVLAAVTTSLVISALANGPRPTSSRHPADMYHQTRPRPAHAPTVQLAGYTLHLPSAYRLVSSCPPIPAGVANQAGVSVAGNNAYASWASATGGCIRAVMEGYPDFRPAGAVGFSAGTHQAYLWNQPDGDIELWLQLPAALNVQISPERKPLYLIFEATGLSAKQVMTTAQAMTVNRTPMPTPLGPTKGPHCTLNCR